MACIPGLESTRASCFDHLVWASTDGTGLPSWACVIAAHRWFWLSRPGLRSPPVRPRGTRNRSARRAGAVQAWSSGSAAYPSAVAQKAAIRCESAASQPSVQCDAMSAQYRRGHESHAGLGLCVSMAQVSRACRQGAGSCSCGQRSAGRRKSSKFFHDSAESSVSSCATRNSSM